MRRVYPSPETRAQRAKQLALDKAKHEIAFAMAHGARVAEPREWYIEKNSGQTIWYSVRGWNALREQWRNQLYDFHAKHCGAEACIAASQRPSKRARSKKCAHCAKANARCRCGMCVQQAFCNDECYAHHEHEHVNT